MKRIFLIVLDSFGIGELPDAAVYGDEGSNTLEAVRKSSKFSVPNLAQIGLFHIDGVTPEAGQGQGFTGCIGRMTEVSAGKDTVTGHWEIAGLPLEKPFPTYPDGFPEEFCREFSRRIGRKLLCNRPYSGTEVLKDFGRQQVETGSLILYTSADSVCQLAAHEEVVPVEELYRCCEIAREMLPVGRIIARPFRGDAPPYDGLPDAGIFPWHHRERPCWIYCFGWIDVISVGKIWDIFAGRSISREFHTDNNDDGMGKTAALAKQDFRGLCFVNLVDFDTKYGHRNDVDGYAAALTRFDRWLGKFLPLLGPEDAVFLTADHGCDPPPPAPTIPGSTPLPGMGQALRRGVNLGTRKTFSDIAKTVLEAFRIDNSCLGALSSKYSEIRPCTGFGNMLYCSQNKRKGKVFLICISAEFSQNTHLDRCGGNAPCFVLDSAVFCALFKRAF